VPKHKAHLPLHRVQRKELARRDPRQDVIDEASTGQRRGVRGGPPTKAPLRSSLYRSSPMRLVWTSISTC